MTGLFSAIDLVAPDSNAQPGFRLSRLEIFNWGTFTERVWTMKLDGRNGLLTGDIGAGKSTVVDAITTLLLQANRISYNKAAGADTRERDLRSYVLGYYKSERNEMTGTSRPVALRRAGSYSVLLGVFTNSDYDTTVSIAQVFIPVEGVQGQPKRFYVIADGDLNIATDFASFSNINELRRRLRDRGAQVFDHFPEYGREFRRRLGIESEQAMELFLQTVSMKSVGDLNEFVRHHMLEPFSAARWTQKLVDHFADLVSAHDAVRRAREQRDQLIPLLVGCDEHDKLVAQEQELARRQDALAAYFGGRKCGLLEQRINQRTTELEVAYSELEANGADLEKLREHSDELKLEVAGFSDGYLNRTDAELARLQREREDTKRRADAYDTLLGQARLDNVSTLQQFSARRGEVEATLGTLAEQLGASENRRFELGARRRELDVDSNRLNGELISLAQRQGNLPASSLQLREWMCSELGLAVDRLPFAGELIAVGSVHTEWEGAAERLLRGLAMSMLVPAENYAAVSEWINSHHLGRRLVYYRVPASIAAAHRPSADSELLVDKLDVRDGEFADWIAHELDRRADYVCAENMDEFRRAEKAITRAGQVKGLRGRHEKNDSHRIDDRTQYVLGWSNESKRAALAKAAAGLQAKLLEVTESSDAAASEIRELTLAQNAASQLLHYTEFRDIDWQSCVNAIQQLQQEREAFISSSGELRRIHDQQAQVRSQITTRERAQQSLNERVGSLRSDVARDQGALATAQRVVEQASAEQLEALESIDFGIELPANPDEFEEAERSAAARLRERHEVVAGRRSKQAQRVVGNMAAFRRANPLETVEIDDAIESAGEYRKMLDQLVKDDLPRFEADFKQYLNTNVIREVAGFHSQLNKQKDLIHQRVALINESLVGIDYNPGRYIELDVSPTQNIEIREFVTALRECTDGSLDDDSDQYSEQRFQRVRVIIERFQGREGFADQDRAWTHRVTDVRNWFTFSASERYRSDGSEHEHYTDSSGKSGGQKEKLAYTILAASLAYQFKLEWGGQADQAIPIRRHRRGFWSRLRRECPLRVIAV